MAVNGLNGRPEVKVNEGATQAPRQEQTQQTQTPRSIGFGGNAMYMMTSNRGSEYTNNIAKKMMEEYGKLPQHVKPKVSVFDKEIIQNLSYSTIVVSLQHKQTVSYFVVVLEETGRKSLTAKDIVNELSITARNPQAKVFLYTTDDAVNKILHREIKNALSNEYPGCDYVPVDGVVIPADIHEMETVIANVAAIGFNACNIESALISGEIRDVNITEALNNTPNGVLRIDSNMLKQTIKDEVSKPIRADFIVNLAIHDNNTQSNQLNLGGTKTVINKISGFVDAIPKTMSIPTMPGMPAVVKQTIAPQIIIDSISPSMPTTGSVLLSVITAKVMGNKDMWMAAVMPGRDNKHNPGVLNLYTNLENEQNGIGKPLPLDNGKYKQEEVIGLVRQIYTAAPIISMDIESFGPQTYYESIFALAAQPSKTKAKAAAAKEIIEVATWLTNGNFPADYNPNEIFIDGGVLIPTGKWFDKDGEKDLREIDMTLIGQQTQDINLMNMWANSGLPASVTGQDPFIAKVNIINKIIPDAVIEGKAIRVTFHPKFLDVLANAAEEAGLRTGYEPAIVFEENNNIGLVSSYYDNAGITGGFGVQSTQQQNQYQMNYGNMGYGRMY